MKDDRKESTPLEQGADTAAHAARAAQQAQRIADYARSAETVAHTSQAAYAVTTAAQGGATAAGAATGTALAGPLGTIVGALLTSKTFWNIVVGILAFIFLWMFIIANMIGIILSYLGFADANSFANEAQSAQLSNMRTRIEQVLANEDYEKEILAIIEQNRDLQIQEINADKAENYADYELQIVDEYETKLKRNLSSYLAVFLTETWDNSSIQSFLGYPNSLGLDMSTDLTSPYDAYFQEAAQTYNVPVALLIAMGKVESDFNPNATSGAGAMGIMQLMPATAASLGVSNPYDPRQNIMGGAKYIAGNIEQFKNYSNGLELAIAAYNAGPGAVIKYGYQIPPYEETQNYVKKVLGYIEIQEGRISSGGNSDESMEDLSAPYGQLKEAVSENVDRFFGWSVTDEKESEVTETAYYFLSESGKTEIEKATYDQLKREGANVTTEAWPTNAKMVEYTIALMQNSQLSGSGSGFEYKYVTDQGTFELVIKVLKVLQDGVQALKDSFFSLFSWTDFVTGGSSTDSYIGNIDATGDIITYNTVGKGVKQVVYYNQVEEPWGSMPYGTSTIGAAGCGPTSLAIVISTLTKQTVTPQMTAAYAISNGEYVSGVGTAHSFPTNAANHWGLTCERVRKDRMDYVVQSLKEGKMVVEICETYTITGSGSGHFIVLTGVTSDGYITIADCASRERTGKVYSVDTIKSYGRDLSAGAFWIIGTK
ncbi:MAG: transglycosylase SLT domain-containing protein [Blautia obeum]|nr:transglycosylase SLT domain-containing protein [Blautia obeum]